MSNAAHSNTARKSKNSKQASEDAIRTAVFLEQQETTKVQTKVEKKKLEKIKKDFLKQHQPEATYTMSTFYTDLNKEQLIVWAKYLERVNIVYATSKAKVEVLEVYDDVSAEMTALTTALSDVLTQSKASTKSIKTNHDEGTVNVDDVSIIVQQQVSAAQQGSKASSSTQAHQGQVVVQNKAYKLDHNTPIFTPNEKLSIKDWFFSIENSMLVAGIPEDLKVPLSANYLKGTAFQIGKRHVLDQKSWEQLKAELIKTFTPVDEERKLRLQLISLRMTDSFSRFNDRFQS